MRRTILIFAVTALIIELSAFLVWSAGERVQRLQNEEEHRRIAIGLSADLLSVLRDAETGQRGFLLTGEESYLEPFTRAESQLPDTVQQFRELGAVGVTKAQSDELAAAIDAKMAELRMTVELRRSGGLGAALPVVMSGEGKAAMNRISAVLDHVRSEQESQLQQNRREISRATRERTVISVGSGIFILGMLTFAYWRIQTIAAEREAARQAAEQANRAKDDFIAMVSHELRTPLVPVLFTLESWDHEPALPPSIREDAALIRRNIQLEARLIDDLLTMSRTGRGMTSVQIENVDAHGVIELAVETHRAESKEKGLELVLQLEAHDHNARADAKCLQQVLGNIVTNAIRYTNRGGTITLATLNESNMLCIRVSDTGIGMTPEQLDNVFEPFQQGDHRRSNQHGGLGLGMAIAKHLVHEMQGEIRASSPGLGHGSTFEVRLATTSAG